MNKMTSPCVLLFLFVGSLSVSAQEEYMEPCESPVYCYGPLLQTVQLSRVYNESKDFVDRSMRHDPAVVLINFRSLGFQGDVRNDPEKMDRLNDFLLGNFEEGNEFVNFTLSDWTANPDFLQGIQDPVYRTWAWELHAIWKDLGRKIKDEVKDSKRTSMLYSPNPVVVPGGRFREFYYWDSYWIQRGLLISGMTETVRGMIENFFQMVETLGYVPNGGRLYYLRTQPPLLLPMVKSYYDVTGNYTFLKENIQWMEKEFAFFMANRTQAVEVGGRVYTMAKYSVSRTDPRPEGYAKEFDIVDPLVFPNEDDKKEVFANVKSACESGWDFSTRWFVLNEGESGPANLSHSKTRDIIPVDLNAFLYWNAEILREFCFLLDITEGRQICSHHSVQYQLHAIRLKAGIKAVLWNEADGSWYDYNYVKREQTKAFYGSNIAPLWVGAHHIQDDPLIVEKLLVYLEDVSGALGFPGGLPTSMTNSGQQWDFPNAWPPLVHMAIEALANTNHTAAVNLATELAANWTESNYLAYELAKAQGLEGGMYEKYDVRVKGCPGGGGFYDTVLGFGWTNGVILDFLVRYGNLFPPAPTVPDNIQCPSFTLIGE